jgi:hypothetical protein
VTGRNRARDREREAFETHAPLRFTLVREGGVIAYGVLFAHPHSRAVLAWINGGESVEVFDTIEAVEETHRPEGREIEWVDTPYWLSGSGDGSGGGDR